MILIAQSQWFENKDPNELLLIFGLFFVVLAFITLICWIFFAGDEGSGRGNRSSGGHSSRDEDYSNRSSGNYSSDGSGGSGQYSSSQTNFGASGMSEALEGYNQGGGSSSTSEVHGYSSTSSSSSMDINRNADFDYDSMPELNQISRSQAEAYFQDDIFNSYARNCIPLVFSCISKLLVGQTIPAVTFPKNSTRAIYSFVKTGLNKRANYTTENMEKKLHQLNSLSQLDEQKFRELRAKTR